EDIFKKEVDDFFSHEYRWHEILLEQGVDKQIIDKIGDTENSWEQNWYTISEHFDIMMWWEKVGKNQFKRIYVIACLILPMPDSNGGQERTFSAATWMDGKLSKRQTEATFQMKIICHQNKEILDKCRHKFTEQSLICAASSTKELVKPSSDTKQKKNTKRGEEMPSIKTVIVPYAKKRKIVNGKEKEGDDSDGYVSDITEVYQTLDSDTSDYDAEEWEIRSVVNEKKIPERASGHGTKRKNDGR
ncbi:MAG: hAT transposon family protein, partial [Cetobacterium sp.]